MNYLGNGACRTYEDEWSGKSLGYISKDDCLRKCKNDKKCRAADVARPNEKGECDCRHFYGNDDTLHSAYDPTICSMLYKKNDSSKNF